VECLYHKTQQMLNVSPPNLSLGLNVGLKVAQFTYRQTTLLW